MKRWQKIVGITVAVLIVVLTTILGIDVLDHVVVAKDAYASFKERKLLHA